MHVEPLSRLSEWCAKRHGVFTVDEAARLGISQDAIEYGARTGVFVRLHPLVYAHAAVPESWLRDLMAAVLWSCGVAGGRAAAKLLGLPGFDAAPLEVLMYRAKPCPRSGVVVHVTNRLPSGQVDVVDGIPCSAIERTIMDVCYLVGRRAGAVALDHALHRGMTTLAACDFALYLSAGRGRRGCKAFRELVRAREVLKDFPNSPLETLILEMLLRDGLPPPVPQFEILDPRGGFIARADFAYPEQRLVIEAHSRLWHAGPDARKRDASRHMRMVGAGYTVLYVTWTDVIERATSTLRLIRERLGVR